MKSRIKSVLLAGTVIVALLIGVALVAEPVFAATPRTGPSHHSTSSSAPGAASGTVNGSAKCLDVGAPNGGRKGSITPPQRLANIEARITCAANKELGFVAKGTAVEPRIQAILTKVSQKGIDVTSASQTFADFESQLTSAKGAAQSALSAVSGITATTPKAAKPTLLQAVSDLKTGRTDLLNARKDIQTLRQDWKSLRKSATSTSTTPPASSGSQPA